MPTPKRNNNTTLELRRGETLLIRVEMANRIAKQYALPLQAAFQGIAQGFGGSPHGHEETVIAEADDVVVIPTLHGDGDDDGHHARVRHQLCTLCSRLCDSSLEDLVQIAREVMAKRAVGDN